MPTLYEIYQQQGKALPGTVESRFADPSFAQAAQQAGITKDQYRINAGNADYNTRIANLYGKAPTPTTPTAPTGTPKADTPVAPALQGISYQESAQGSQTPAPSATNTPIGSVFNLPSLSTITDQENALGELYRKQAAGEDIVDTSKIRSETLAEFQDRINALNRIYDQQLARARQAGVGRVGQGTAVLAARGLAGSGRGMAVQDSILDQNRQEQEAIDAERQAALAEVYGVANTQAIEAARAKREAILGGAKSYIEFLKGAEERKKTNLSSTISALLTQGIDPSTMSPDELNSITSKIGASSSELIAAFKEGKIAKDAAQSELARKIAKEEAELGKLTTETQLMKDKFEEDKRRFGLEYAIKQQELGLKQAEFGLKQSETAKATGIATMTDQQLDFLNSSLDKAEQLKGAAGRGGISRAIGGAISGDNDFNRLSKTLDSVKTNVLTLMSDPNVKKFFGPQMTNNDVQLMMSIGTTLDPVSNSPQDIQDEVTRIRDLINRAQNAVKTGESGTNMSVVSQNNQSISQPQQMRLPNGSIVNLQPDGTYK